MILALAGATGLLAVVDWYAVIRGRRGLERWAKPATLLAMTATAIAAGAVDHTAGRWLVVALLLGTVGDVALLGRGVRRFVAGLAAFLLGHLAYLACFVALGVAESWWVVGGAAVVVLSIVAARDVLPGARRAGGPGLAGAVAAYMTVIGAMTVTGWATGQPLVALGTAVFVVSDTTLALDRFVEERPWARPVVMVTYHAGQALIAAGVLIAA